MRFCRSLNPGGGGWLVDGTTISKDGWVLNFAYLEGSATDIRITSINVANNPTDNSLLDLTGGVSGGLNIVELGVNEYLDPNKKITTSLFFNGNVGDANIKTVKLPDTVKVIGWSAFHNCANLESVTLSANLETIGAYAFAGTKSLTSIEPFLPATVKRIEEGAFFQCGVPQDLVLGEDYEVVITDGNAVRQWGYGAFAQSMLTGLTLGSKVTAGFAGIYGTLVQSCSNLEKFIVEDGATIEGTVSLTGCSNLKELSLGDGVKELPNGFFSQLSSLKYLVIGDGLTALPNTSTFASNSDLEEVVVGKNIEELPDYCFNGNTKLKRIVFSPGGKLKTIGKYGIRACPELTSIEPYFPATLETIGEGALCGPATSIAKLSDFRFAGGKPVWNADAFKDQWTYPAEQVRFFIPKGETGTTWNAFLADASQVTLTPWASVDAAKQEAYTAAYPDGPVPHGLATPVANGALGGLSEAWIVKWKVPGTERGFMLIVR